MRTRLNSTFHVQYKFKVDGEWRYDPLAPLARDQEGNLNNVLELLDPQLGYELPADFDAPPSPVARYCWTAGHCLSSQLGRHLCYVCCLPCRTCRDASRTSLVRQLCTGGGDSS